MAPDGTMLFLHRTAGSKMDPSMDYPPGYAPVGYVTPPLTPRQAAHVHIAGAMVLQKFDAERPRLCSVPDGLNLTGLAQGCGMLASPNPRGRGVVYGDVSRFFPVPLFEASEFPGLEGLLEASMQAFRHLQHQFRRGRIRLGQPPGMFEVT